MEVRTIVLRVDGTNCDEETVISFKKAGSTVDLAHVNELIRKEKSLEDYQVLCIPGGFTYGDDIAAGKIFAILLKYKLSKDIKKFVEEGKLVIGICNGFQVLVKTGLLPALEGIMKKQEATLAFNDCGYFQDRWIYLKHENKGKCVFTKGIKDIIHIPVNHAEGKFVADRDVIRRLEKNDQVVFKYVDPDGNYAGFPWTPNGSMDNIAGICNPEGNVFGLMPHPEKFIHKWTHPYWTRLPGSSDVGDGFAIFKNAVEFAKKKL
ncbi:MAG: phosphoribosylformylglycinamidine synthase subunit PurQ [Candidatus Aenigmarchaeota archaeon]|nr:phosphoribosylformylglycinamidine synthase subunit PurQ [Candidatus Aenigmarchaeota archaeon]